MRTQIGTAVAAALLTVAAANVGAQGDQGRSQAADQHDERVLEGVQARSKASERVRWHDPAGRLDPTISVKLLGINDFHGQLSPRTVGLRPAGGASVLAAYLEAAADQADGAAFIIHAAIISARRRRLKPPPASPHSGT